MNRYDHLVVWLPDPLEQHRQFAEIVYRWVSVLYVLLLSAAILFALVGV